MAVLDRERNLIVLRIVYDGPPEAGKTTSLRALAGSLGQALHTPAERDGRTLYFDWMDYTGGRFEGYQIRCQVVTVPGQRELHARRQALMGEADVVVFVADSTEAHVDETFERLREVPVLTSNVLPPPVGIIFQANKRDLPTAVPIPDLQARVHAAGLKIAVIGSIAAEGTGIRETFVFAVRLALDRVREQLRQEVLPIGAPAVDDGAELLRRMKDADEATALALPALEQVLAENDDDTESEGAGQLPTWDQASDVARSRTRAPAPPEPSAPSGSIWPPVEGRLVLFEACQAGMSLARQPDGAWSASLAGGWRTHSNRNATYRELEAGREALIRWARLHAACGGLASTSRCIVLAATGKGSWRLWQIVRVERTLRDELACLGQLSRDAGAAKILEVATLLCEMSARLQSVPYAVPCSLDTIGRGDLRPMYVGLMPAERARAAAGAPPPGLIGPDTELLFHTALIGRRHEMLEAIARAPRSGPTAHGAAFLDGLLAQRAAI